jgi:hypothetical protein
MTTKPLGRPARGEVREQLVKVAFKADAEVLAALERMLARAHAKGHKRARSAVIRAAILAADRASEAGSFMNSDNSPSESDY